MIKKINIFYSKVSCFYGRRQKNQIVIHVSSRWHSVTMIVSQNQSCLVSTCSFSSTFQTAQLFSWKSWLIRGSLCLKIIFWEKVVFKKNAYVRKDKSFLDLLHLKFRIKVGDRLMKVISFFRRFSRTTPYRHDFCNFLHFFGCPADVIRNWQLRPMRKHSNG